MTSESQKCGLSSFLSMSCRGRVEAFAKKLNSRLRTLGSDDDNGSADESSWLAANEDQVSLSQPRQNLDLDLELELDSPGSLAPDPEEHETRALINRDTLRESISNLRHSHSDNCQCPKSKDHQKNLSRISNSNDSDSDCSFYDTENDLEQRLGGYSNGDNDSESSRSQESISTTQDETFATTSDGTPQPSSSSGNTSTLSLRDEDCPSLEINGSPDGSRCEQAGHNCTNCNSESIASVGETRNSDKETYVSHLTVDGDLIVECTSTVEATAELVVNGSLSSTDVTSSSAEKEDSSEDLLEDEEADGRSPRVKRSSSLKSGKTPPSTPGEKKIVRFADVLGLDLADVRTFLDEIPRVPVSAFVDLPGADLDRPSGFSSAANFRANKTERFLMPLFQQPGGLPNFLDLVKERQVCLENAFVKDSSALSISGIVRVRNLDFHKSLHIRYSLDSWKTFADVQATYVNNSCDGFSDKFSFLLYAHTLSLGQRIEFACRFHCKGCQYWDNNNGANYCFQCLPTTRSTARYSPIEDCGAGFYYHGDESTPTTSTTPTTTKAMQDRIMNSLADRKKAQPQKNANTVFVFLIVIFSVLFLYLQKAIYFTK